MKRSKRQPPLYVGIPRPLLMTPPIAFRGSTVENRIDPFTFFVLAAVLIEARAVLYDDIRTQALAAGAELGAVEIERRNKFKAEWRETKRRRFWGHHAEAPQIQHTFMAEPVYKPVSKPGPSARCARSVGYRQKREQLRRSLPADTTVMISRHALLTSIGLKGRGRNIDKLPAALDRLCEQVGDKPTPLLIDWTMQDDQLRLGVSGQWLGRKFGRVPLQLPYRAAPLALYLFLIGLNPPTYFRGKMSSLKSLCEKLGLPHGKPSNSLRTIRKALDIINDGLPDLDREALDELRTPLDMPVSYQMQVSDHHGEVVICFKSVWTPDHDEPDAEEREEAYAE
jgi:hypothetical protein